MLVSIIVQNYGNLIEARVLYVRLNSLRKEDNNDVV